MFGQGLPCSPNRIDSQSAMLKKEFVYGSRGAKYMTYCLLDDPWVILSTSKAFYYFFLITIMWSNIQIHSRRVIVWPVYDPVTYYSCGCTLTLKIWPWTISWLSRHWAKSKKYRVDNNCVNYHSITRQINRCRIAATLRRPQSKTLHHMGGG